MPKSPQSHVTGRRAVVAISKIFTDLKCACEIISNDYGEDILVQTFFEEEVDSFRIWVQSKGTENIDSYKRGQTHYEITFSINHILKWVHGLDPVIIILWDVKNDVGYWADPKSHISDIYNVVGMQSIKVRFRSLDIFDEEFLEGYIRQCRTMHYFHLLKIFENDDNDKDYDEYAKNSRAILLIKLFLQLDVLTDKGDEYVLTVDFRMKISQHVSKKYTSIFSHEDYIDSLIIVLLGYLEERRGQKFFSGLTVGMIERMISVIAQLAPYNVILRAYE